MNHKSNILFTAKQESTRLFMIGQLSKKRHAKLFCVPLRIIWCVIFHNCGYWLLQPMKKPWEESRGFLFVVI
ncbi:hypothetical protein AEM51_02175 [Bacteroidetes bacterium UKL13-3]|nr:hypothetical protein AEM51_02175 [Bacteroidetes bacterium UKL13-3]HCP94436.1 hypothetical protein [Bacteroidota bacterium]